VKEMPENGQNDCFFSFLTFFCKKVFTGLDLGPITRLHRRGAALNETARRSGGDRVSAFEFFDIVDKQEGMRGQRYGAKSVHPGDDGSID
jgi:hypothetical protein